MRLLVCGGRSFGLVHSEKLTISSALQTLHNMRRITLLIHGAARGADSIAASIAHANQITCAAFPANWALHGKSAGARRNTMMLQAQPDLILAFPGGRGTADMVCKALQGGFTVINCDANGALRESKPL